MSKASEDALAELHGALAAALTEAVRGVKDPETGTVMVASAAHMAVAATFLKNNNITADPSSNQGLSDLQQALNAKRAEKKGQLSQRDIDSAAAMLERDLPGFMQ